MSRLDFDALWDYEHPDQTEVAFRQLLPQAEHSYGRSYHLQLLTQIARTQSLQRKFVEAHQTLDDVKGELRAELVVPTIRYLLERGRTFNSSGHPDEALTLFQQAWDLASKHTEAAFFAVDAAHMLAIASSSFEEKITWNTTALQAAETSTDEQARGWCRPLYNNLGWTYHDQGEYERALAYFQKALQWQQERARGADCPLVSRANAAFVTARERGPRAARGPACGMGKARRGAGRLYFRGDRRMPARLRPDSREPALFRSGIREASSSSGYLAGGPGPGDGTVRAFEAVG